MKLLKYRPDAYHHVTFATKRRKKVLAGEVKERVHFWFEEIARTNGIQLLEHNSWLDHVHMLIYVGIGEDLSAIMHRLKGTCARRIFQEFPDLKHQIRENHLWGRRFRADEVPFEALDEVKQYIRNQEDIHLNRASQMPMKRLERWKDLVDY